MKIACAFPPMLVGGRPLDFHNLWTDPRGTTGSEIVALRFPIELAKRGHDVTLYSPKPNADAYQGVKLREYGRLFDESGDNDVVTSVLAVGLFDHLKPGPLRVLFQQINDFEYARPGFDDNIDVFISPSDGHRERMAGFTPKSAHKWHVVSNGCDPSEYPSIEKVPGRCVYLSSPDRGLHLVLEQWEAIRARVPHAHLRIFYYALQKWIDLYGDPNFQRRHAVDDEGVRRVKSVRRVLKHAEELGIEVMGSVSRVEMAHQLAEAECLTFPADCITYTESFSCATLEAMAAGAVPVIADCDAMGGIYKGACPMVARPAHKHIGDWTDMVELVLQGGPWAQYWRDTGHDFAAGRSWPRLAVRLEMILEGSLYAKRHGIDLRSADAKAAA